MTGSVALLAAGVMACGDSGTDPTLAATDLAVPWSESSPQAEGLDPSAIDDALADAAAIPPLRSLLVVRHGRLVAEEYYAGNHADSLNDVRSVTKSVVSTLTEIALRQGYLTSLEQTLGELLPDAPFGDPAQRDITVWQLLEMGGGFDWPQESASAYNAWRTSDDPVAYLLEVPMRAEPGTEFAYNSASAHLLGVVLEEVTGQSLEAYADQVLFGPLGITRRRWEPMTGGGFNGGAGLDLRPRDLARLGQLFLQEGRSGSTQIVSRSWTYEATRPHWPWRTQIGPLDGVSYGYLWWTCEHPRGDLFFALGWGGQFVLVQRSTDLVVVATTEWRGMEGDEEGSATIAAVLDVIAEQIPAAVMN